MLPPTANHERLRFVVRETAEPVVVAVICAALSERGLSVRGESETPRPGDSIVIEGGWITTKMAVTHSRWHEHLSFVEVVDARPPAAPQWAPLVGPDERQVDRY